MARHRPARRGPTPTYSNLFLLFPSSMTFADKSNCLSLQPHICSIHHTKPSEVSRAIRGEPSPIKARTTTSRNFHGHFFSSTPSKIIKHPSSRTGSRDLPLLLDARLSLFVTRRGTSITFSESTLRTPYKHSSSSRDREPCSVTLHQLNPSDADATLSHHSDIVSLTSSRSSCGFWGQSISPRY